MQYAAVPMNYIGPLKITGAEVDAIVKVPLATYETPLWPSTNRGAKAVTLCGGAGTTISSDKMTRSILVEAESAADAARCISQIKYQQELLAEIVANTSRFACLEGVHSEQVAQLIFLRFEFSTGDASGHNMVTKAAQELQSYILSQYPELKYVSLSGNYCTDKKVSAVNGILGRGKHVTAEVVLNPKVCQEVLKTTPEKLAALNYKKNWVGSTIAGGVRSANAHFANVLLGFYLATGQDAANIVEGSQGFVYTELRDNGCLYFSVTIPNLILGTVGHGKGQDFVQENLAMLGCMDDAVPGANARRLACIAAATVLCGELSLLAALTNPKELMQSHIAMERNAADVYRSPL